MDKFSLVHTINIQGNGIETIPGGIQWSKSLEEITLTYNPISLIEPFAFSSASNLAKILISSSENVHVLSNGFHTTSNQNDKEIQLYPKFSVAYEANAFGNVDGGELWQRLDIPVSANGFSEDVFRLMIKAYSDKGHTGTVWAKYQEPLTTYVCSNLIFNHSSLKKYGL